MSRKPSRSGKQSKGSTTTTATNCIPFEDAVVEAKAIIAAAEQGELRLGELAAKLEPKYGDRTLAKFADAIGISACTVSRHRDVYNAWRDKCAPGRKLPSYSVCRELAKHPDREKIIEANPDITKSQAHAEMRRFKNGEQDRQEEQQEAEWLKDDRRWFKELCLHAQEARSRANVALECEPEKQQELLKVVDEVSLNGLRGASNRLRQLAEQYEELLARAKKAAEAAKAAEQEAA